MSRDSSLPRSKLNGKRVQIKTTRRVDAARRRAERQARVAIEAEHAVEPAHGAPALLGVGVGQQPRANPRSVLVARRRQRRKVNNAPEPPAYSGIFFSDTS